MANPWGGRRQWAQAVQQRRMQRLRPFQRLQPQAAQPWRPAASFAPNPLVQWWRNSLRQGIAWQRQLAEVRVAQLKAAEQALSTTGSSPYRFAAGLPRFAGWGAGVSPWTISPTEYSTLDASSTDASTVPASTTVDTSPPPPPSDTSEEGTDGGRKPPNRVVFEIFDDMDEHYHGKAPGFTENGYPAMSVFNDKVDDSEHGPEQGFVHLSRDEMRALYDHHVHLSTLRKAEEEEEKKEGKKKPTQDDFLKAFKALKTKEGEKLTKNGYPRDDAVDDYLHDHGFDVSSLNVDKVHRAFDRTGDFADDWREEEGKSKGGGGEHEKEEPEQDDFLKAFKAVKKAGHKLTKQGYPPDDEVDKYLDGRGFDVSSLNVDKVHRAFDKTGDFADDWREEEGKSKGGEQGGEKGKPKSDDFVASFKALKRENKKLTKDGYPHESDVEEYLRKQGFDVESLKTDRMHREFDKTGDFAEDWREEGR